MNYRGMERDESEENFAKFSVKFLEFKKFTSKILLL